MTPVKEFFESFELSRPSHPSRPSNDDIRLCMRLIQEEHKEVREEFLDLLNSKSTARSLEVLPKLLKELADLRYVVEYAAVKCGLDIDGAFAEVHRSNMTKLDANGRPVRDAGGKVLKGPNYEPADMSKFVQGAVEHEC